MANTMAESATEAALLPGNLVVSGERSLLPEALGSVVEHHPAQGTVHPTVLNNSMMKVLPKRNFGLSLRHPSLLRM